MRRRYNPEGKQVMTLWVHGDGRWLLDGTPSYRRGWHGVRIEVSDILQNEELEKLIRNYVDDAPRLGNLINFHAWRWWQEAQEAGGEVEG